MPNIYDNITDDTRLGLALRDSLSDFDTVDVATGYIDLRGWSSMADILDSKPAPDGSRATARVLVGMVAPSDSQQLLDSLQDQVQPPSTAPTSTTANEPWPGGISSSRTCATSSCGAWPRPRAKPPSKRSSGNCARAWSP